MNARAQVNADGVGGQTPIFHALTHFKGVNPEVAKLLIARGADLTIRARVAGHYEHPGEILDVSAAEYAKLFPLKRLIGSAARPAAQRETCPRSCSWFRYLCHCSEAMPTNARKFKRPWRRTT